MNDIPKNSRFYIGQPVENKWTEEVSEVKAYNYNDVTERYTYLLENGNIYFQEDLIEYQRGRYMQVSDNYCKGCEWGKKTSKKVTENKATGFCLFFRCVKRYGFSYQQRRLKND